MEVIPQKLFPVTMLPTFRVIPTKFGCSEKEFQKRSFRWYVPCVPRWKGIPLGTSRWNAFPETPFPNALRVRKRSVTKGVCTGHLAHVPRYVPFYLQNSKGIPLGTSTWNALSETPFPNTRKNNLTNKRNCRYPEAPAILFLRFRSYF